MSKDTEADSTTVQPKYTRYRSVRRAAAEESAAKEQAITATASELNASGNGPIQRSMSRYRRSRAPSKVDPTNPLTAVPAVPTLPTMPLAIQANQDVSVGVTRRATDPTSTNQAQTTQFAPQRNTSDRERTAGREIEDQRVFALTVEEKLAEQKRKDLERLEATLDAAIQGPQIPRINTPVKEKFGFFSRRRAHAKTAPPMVPTTVLATAPTPVVAPVLPASRSASLARSGGSNDTLRRSNERPLPVIVPGTDAPISAVNAGERRVLVRHKQSSINLPINPNTIALDIFFSSANIMTHDLVPANTVLLESYTQLGLERRVRRYERIRDIMNSWDRDTQNALILQHSDAPKYDADLESSSVPKDPPPDVTVYLYHSQKPGRWHKRYVTLLASGQMYMSKKEKAKTTDKDVVNLCHLSDFDIYTPVPAQVRKLKAPKKHCYAVKSQQRTAMFLSTENFVHFFSSDDELLAHKWYGAVQRWRSWYLVHRMGEGEAERRVKGNVSSRPTASVPAGRAAQQGAGINPYLVGFQPPYNAADHADHPPEADNYDSEEDSRDTRPTQIPFHLRNAPPRDKRRPPPVSYRLPSDVDEEFASSSLLGRTYSDRLKAQREREAQQEINKPKHPADGPCLIGNTPSHSRSHSVRSSRTARDHGRGKPLLDFTPQYKEAPQWDRTGRGRGVTAPDGVPLVQVATGPGRDGLGAALEMPKMDLFHRAAARPRMTGESIMNRGNGV